MALTKMIGVCSLCLRWRMSAAVSKPSITGMLTSSRMTANSSRSSRRRASLPDEAVTMFCPSSTRIDSSARIFSGRSSTTRMLTLSSSAGEPSERGLRGAASVISAPSLAARRLEEPDAQQRQQLLGVDRLGDVVRGAGVDALLAVALHRLGGQRDDRQRAEASVAADGAHGV